MRSAVGRVPAPASEPRIPHEPDLGIELGFRQHHPHANRRTRRYEFHDPLVGRRTKNRRQPRFERVAVHQFRGCVHRATLSHHNPRCRTISGNRGRYRGEMGFNPFRSRVNRRTDIVIVVAAAVVILALVVWALFGG